MLFVVSMSLQPSRLGLLSAHVGACMLKWSRFFFVTASVLFCYGAASGCVKLQLSGTLHSMC